SRWASVIETTTEYWWSTTDTRLVTGTQHVSFMFVVCPVYCGSEIAAVIALTMMTSKTPTCSAIASNVNASQATLGFFRQIRLRQTSKAATGMRQNSARTSPAGGAGSCHLSQTTSDRK